MTIQAIVEEEHRTSVIKNDMLVKLVEKAFKVLDVEKQDKVNERWEKNLESILKK